MHCVDLDADVDVSGSLSNCIAYKIITLLSKVDHRRCQSSLRDGEDICFTAEYIVCMHEVKGSILGISGSLLIPGMSREGSVKQSVRDPQEQSEFTALH